MHSLFMQSWLAWIQALIIRPSCKSERLTAPRIVFVASLEPKIPVQSLQQPRKVGQERRQPAKTALSLLTQDCWLAPLLSSRRGVLRLHPMRTTEVQILVRGPLQLERFPAPVSMTSETYMYALLPERS